MEAGNFAGMALSLLPLTTDRLVPCAYRRSDAEWLQRIYSRPDVAQYLLEGPWTAEHAVDEVEKRAKKDDVDAESAALALIIEHGGALTPESGHAESSTMLGKRESKYGAEELHRRVSSPGGGLV